MKEVKDYIVKIHRWEEESQKIFTLIPKSIHTILKEKNINITATVASFLIDVAEELKRSEENDL